MACSICNLAGHDEEIHGDEGEEILTLRDQVRGLRASLASLVASVDIANHRGWTQKQIEAVKASADCSRERL